MMSTRALGLGPTLRRNVLASRLAARNQLVRPTLGRRAIQTESLPPSAATEILNKQRLVRPSSPHMTIYQPQLTWFGSIANRFTGGALSALLYGYAIAYLVAPSTFSSVNVVEFIAGMPDLVKLSGKAILAAPFAYHSLNGLRHLSWDMGYFLSLKGAYQSGYAVLTGTALSTIALLFM